MLFLLLLSELVQLSGQVLPTCLPQNFHYELTECDNRGGRWRVSVPDPNTCTGGVPDPPIRIDSCAFTCSPGEYFAVSGDLQCHKCQPGSYSLGSAISYDDWATLPADFRNYTEVDMEALAGTDTARDDQLTNASSYCTKDVWWPQHTVVATSPPPACMSVLTLTVTLAREGYMQFTYQFADASDVVFALDVQNDQCRSVGSDSIADNLLQPSGKGQWRTETVRLSVGRNVVKWSVLNVAQLRAPDHARQHRDAPINERRRRPSVQLRSVFVNGTGYTSQCYPCPAGYASNVTGAASCLPCGRDSYSANSAVACTPCPPDQYAPPHSPVCQPRPACTVKHFYHLPAVCTSLNISIVQYNWVQPVICRADLPGAMALPPASNQPCGPCNPGMQRVALNGTLRCQWCPAGFFSNGNSSCAACPDGQLAVPLISFLRWQEMPDYLRVGCVDVEEDRCVNQALAWLAAGDYLVTTSFNQPTNYLTLSLKLSPRADSDDAAHRAVVQFEFELLCPSGDGVCQLYFALESSSDHPTIIKSWRGSRTRSSYRYSFKLSSPVVVRWIFVQYDVELGSPDGDMSQFAVNEARIYSIVVSGAANGGAPKCTACQQASGVAAAQHANFFEKFFGDALKMLPGEATTAPDAAVQSCSPCPAGHYFNDTSRICILCPADSLLVTADQKPFTSGSPVLDAYCTPCPPGLVADATRTVCYSNCHYNSPRRSGHYDFSFLAGFHEVSGRALFMSSGRSYHHVFNISLCTDGDRPVYPVCRSNETTALKVDTTESIEASVCRSTIIPIRKAKVTEGGKAGSPTSQPAAGGGDTVVAFRPVMLGLQLLNMSEDQSDPVVGTSWRKAGFGARDGHDEAVHDVDLVFGGGDATEACPAGLLTIVTLRCDPLRKGVGDVARAPACIDATCDGCIYHLLWRSEHACPLCDEAQFDTVLGECINGLQSVQYIPSKYCRLARDKRLLQLPQRSCSLLPKSPIVWAAVGGAVGFLALLALLVCYFWRRNRTLEYRYMRLISRRTNDGGYIAELAGADTCALSTDEEEVDAGGTEAGKKKKRAEGAKAAKRRLAASAASAVLQSLSGESGESDDGESGAGAEAGAGAAPGGQKAAARPRGAAADGSRDDDDELHFDHQAYERLSARAQPPPDSPQPPATASFFTRVVGAARPKGRKQHSSHRTIATGRGAEQRLLRKDGAATEEI